MDPIQIPPSGIGIRILTEIKDGKYHTVGEIAQSSGLNVDLVRREVNTFQQNNTASVDRTKSEKWVLTRSGENVVKSGYLPEEYFLSILSSNSKDVKSMLVDFQKLSIKYGSSAQDAIRAFAAALGLCKVQKLIEPLADGSFILTEIGKNTLNNYPLKKVLFAVANGDDVKDVSSLLFLQQRGLVEKKTESIERVKIEKPGIYWLNESRANAIMEKPDEIGQITPEILRTKEWMKRPIREYDVTNEVEPRYAGRIHPLRHVIADVRRVMIELGFSEQESPLVESAFWNMDVMFIPQDHPAREIQDTFYLPGRGILEDAELAKRIKATHEHGGKTGSKGFGYEWDPKIATQLLLRTHGSATTFRTLARSPQPPLKTFSIGRVFRNEAIDATHLAEFHQVDGLIMGEGLTLRHLMGIITEFYARLGVTKIKFKPTYNPYTEPSMEALAYHDGLGKWVEIINSGMFRPETLRPLGIHVPVISWGFGLERLALFIHEKSTLKEIAGPDVDIDWIRTYNGAKHTLSEGDSHGQR